MELIVGFLLGFLVGCFLACFDVRTNRRKKLLSHLTDLPYLLLLYLAVTAYSVVIDAPVHFRFIVSGMVGVEGGLMLVAKRLRKGSD